MAIERRDEAATQAIVTPAEADRVLEMIKAFEYFKSHVLTVRDVVAIQGKPFVKKSGWSKYALACNVSTELKDERVEERDGHRIYHFTYRAVHLPSGRYAEAVGSASEAERREWNHPEHDVRTLAQTRAFNRAISNLVGGGEISAEEMEVTTRRHVRSEPVRASPRVERPEVLVDAPRVGPPPRVEPAPEPEPEPVEEAPPGSVEDVRERLANHIVGLDEWLVVSERAEYFRVGRRKRLDEEMERTVGELVGRMGGAWSDYDNCWTIPRGAGAR